MRWDIGDQLAVPALVFTMSVKCSEKLVSIEPMKMRTPKELAAECCLGEGVRLDFNILWVEDQPDYVKAQIDKIGQLMQEEGFHCNPTLCIGSMDDVRKVISTDVFADEIDLVLVDWDWGSNLHGEDAIEAIREEVRYKDVVFYSGQTVPEDLRRKVFDRGLEGNAKHREQLSYEVIGVFESLIKKVVDLDHTRANRNGCNERY